MRLTTVLGFLAGTLTTISFLPQVIKAWRSRSSRDLSLTMLLALATGVILWLVYGFMRNEGPIIMANAVTLVLVLALIFLKLRYGT